MGSLRNLASLKRRTFSIWKSMYPTKKAPFLASYFSHSHHLKPSWAVAATPFVGINARNLCSRTDGPAPIDYHSILQEDEYQKLANSTIHDLLEKLEEYGDSVDIDGFDIDYGNEVLTVKFGDLGTYVINKQTPNRQIWMSSPVSGPSRFDWDHISQAWIYRRTKANLCDVLEGELEKLCGRPVKLS